MKIINASYEILEDELSKLTICERLERTGRICYKSEDKMTKESAAPWCKRMLANEHMSTMEMCRVHIIMDYVHVGYQSAHEIRSHYKYLDVDVVPSNNSSKERIIISGSIRSFLELVNNTDYYLQNNINFIYLALCIDFLNKEIPELFNAKCPKLCVHKNTVRFATDDEIPYSHKYIAVKFIVNRAVTHELVRHRPCTFLQESQRYCCYAADKFGNEVTFIAPTAFYHEILDINDPNEELNIWTESMAFAEQQYFKLLKTSSPQAARTVLPNSCKTEIIVYTNTFEWNWIFKLRTSLAADPSMRQVMIPLHAEMLERGYI